MSDRLTIEQRHNNMADCAYTQGVLWLNGLTYSLFTKTSFNVT